ncbi:hypothetical protein FNF29_01283 [Cafeteria roenbergensis]|uniref:Methylmalonic aciduria and homocystinuria type D protein n=1 Tax=Cafeteria roenbergensis TaxID=33653 RepID=A0A5A8DK05_CAFRO|nr:hypothetical protein FNF29_01283 [Cafeteria roenbergensis]KAA0164984.1 hypothetical protein FNF28_03607 [Cafeteria roenbergensis]|eukprot:KAA0155863.1 hypothetical protein FNF29_01283 [Cafeteria roenbergensis]
MLASAHRGAEAPKEKDDCLERFAAWARCVCDQLLALGHWADFIDPCSGHPMLAEGRGAVFSEVDCFASMLRYPVADAGGCRIVLHPAWGSRFYPATMFTTAPLRVLVRAVAVAAGGEPAGDKDPWLLAAAEGTAPDHQDPDA